ncbi:hypothetical protein ACFCZT_30435 [Streptomyces sp. NPDC056230]|uniref:hypothetical protein n=1 Tax=unclassified Streptomyces TaxID=2593676 RepID=UPI0035D76B11
MGIDASAMWAVGTGTAEIRGRQLGDHALPDVWFEGSGVQGFAAVSVVDERLCVELGCDGVEGQFEVVESAVCVEALVQLVVEADFLADAGELGGLPKAVASRPADEEGGRAASEQG